MPLPQPLPDDSRPDLIHLPIPLTNAVCAEDIPRFVGSGRSIQIYTKDAAGQATPIPTEQIVSADLSSWAAQAKLADNTVALDVEHGRLAFANRQSAQVLTSYCYGALADLGGGPYDRRHTLADQSRASWQIELPLDGKPPTFDTAIEQWTQHCTDLKSSQRRPYGIIRLVGNGTYTNSAPTLIYVPQDGTLAALSDIPG